MVYGMEGWVQVSMWCMGWREGDGRKGAGERVVHGMEGRVQVSMWCMGWRDGCR